MAANPPDPQIRTIIEPFAFAAETHRVFYLC